MATIEIRESSELAADLDINEEACVVKGIKILGPVSRNGWLFPRDSRLKSHKLLEGAPCNWNHIPKGTKEIPPEIRFGWFTGVREDAASDCTRADLNYFGNHPHAKHFLDVARRNPKLLSMSVFADCNASGVDSQGRKIMSELTRVHSVDVVGIGANTHGLRESEEPAAAAESQAPAESGGGKDFTAAGCVAACLEVLNGEGDDRSKLKALKAHLEQLAELEGEGDDESKTVEESAKLVTRKGCITLCESAGIDADDTLLSLMVNVPETAWPGLVAKYKRTKLAKSPRSGPTSTNQLREAASLAAVAQEPEDFEKRMDRLASLVLN